MKANGFLFLFHQDKFRNHVLQQISKPVPSEPEAFRLILQQLETAAARFEHEGKNAENNPRHPPISPSFSTESNL